MDQDFSLLLPVIEANSRADWTLSPWYGNSSRNRKTVCLWQS